jgi:hypothetical protein
MPEDTCDTCPALEGHVSQERVGRACDLEAAVEVCEALAVVLQCRLDVSACITTYESHAVQEAEDSP